MRRTLHWWPHYYGDPNQGREICLTRGMMCFADICLKWLTKNPHIAGEKTAEEASILMFILQSKIGIGQMILTVKMCDLFQITPVK